jgi:predicted PurR-regulated permease PerM
MTPEPPHAAAAPATAAERAAWLCMAGGLLAILHYHLLPALLAGLLVHALLHRLTGRIAGRMVSHGAAKVLAAFVFSLVAVGVTAGVVLVLVGLVRGHLGDLPALFQKMAEVLDGTRLWLEQRGGPSLIPEAARDAEQLKGLFADWLRDHAKELPGAGGRLGRFIFHAVVGMAVGLLVFFRRPAPSTGPLAQALAERVRRLEGAFEAIVFAQVKISAINTGLTALYLLVALPILGVRLPFAGTLVAVTFLTGLIPVVGNLLSNSVIVVIALGVSPWTALLSLAFLIVVHKLEYVLNAHIVGVEINAAAWEILAALFGAEAIFGVPGVVVAPVVYAYAKKELRDRGLV